MWVVVKIFQVSKSVLRWLLDNCWLSFASGRPRLDNKNAMPKTEMVFATLIRSLSVPFKSKVNKLAVQCSSQVGFWAGGSAQSKPHPRKNFRILLSEEIGTFGFTSRTGVWTAVAAPETHGTFKVWK